MTTDRLWKGGGGGRYCSGVADSVWTGIEDDRCIYPCSITSFCWGALLRAAHRSRGSAGGLEGSSGAATRSCGEPLRMRPSQPAGDPNRAHGGSQRAAAHPPRRGPWLGHLYRVGVDPRGTFLPCATHPLTSLDPSSPPVTPAACGVAARAAAACGLSLPFSYVLDEGRFTKSQF